MVYRQQQQQSNESLHYYSLMFDIILRKNSKQPSYEIVEDILNK